MSCLLFDYLNLLFKNKISATHYNNCLYRNFSQNDGCYFKNVEISSFSLLLTLGIHKAALFF